MSDTQHTALQVKFDGKFTVEYVNSKGEKSAFRCTPDVGTLFAAAPDLLTFVEDFYAVLGWSQAEMSQRAKALIAKAKPQNKVADESTGNST